MIYLLAVSLTNWVYPANTSPNRSDHCIRPRRPVVDVIPLPDQLTATIMAAAKVLDQLGRQGAVWFEHQDDRSVPERPSEDAPDLPLPRRPLRGRPGG